MNLKSDPLADAADVMREAGVQLDAVSKMMDGLEIQQKEFLKLVNQVIDYADKLEIERNAWRFRAEEMEGKLRDARHLAVKLRGQMGEPCCPECGGLRPSYIRAGDQCWTECPECGHKEDAI